MGGNLLTLKAPRVCMKHFRIEVIVLAAHGPCYFCWRCWLEAGSEDWHGGVDNLFELIELTEGSIQYNHNVDFMIVY